MLKYILKRLLQSVFTLFIIATVVFLLMRLMPESGYFGEEFDKMDPEQIEASLKAMGLRDPIPVQLMRFYTSILKGDFGKSIVFRPNVDVMKIIKQKVPYSLPFGLASVAIGLVVGISIGVLMARFKHQVPDMLGNAYVVIINAVPAAVYYLFIQIYISDLLKLPILYDADKPVSWILPAVSMSLSGIAYYAMWMRRYMLDQMTKDYISFARAKGLSNKKLMVRHVVRNAFVPIAQYLPASVLMTISGSIYVESLFSIPGMGGLLIAAIQRQDNPLVQALVLIYSSIGILGLLFGDLLMALCDPRIKLGGKGGANR
ncbi:MAG: ABC transporter permease [Christensenellaceae bacterium]|nr:ABC transporter permease [Christensenellaceae bacterium]MDD7496015.1 ABC transporter permease [Christensenellaceae bacterium]MDY3975842.1 ABC transporter permease [Eubacteriales bacterium]MDY5719237.1 ABC transporter permease [Eubacteriales bacterium]